MAVAEDDRDATDGDLPAELERFARYQPHRAGRHWRATAADGTPVTALTPQELADALAAREDSPPG